MERIIYYPQNDLAHYWALEDIPSFFQKVFDFANINDVLEILSVNKYLEEPKLKEYYGETKYINLLRQIKKITPACYSFLQNLNDTNITTIIEISSYEYKKFFWDLFCKIKLYEKISPEIFINTINETNSLELILKNDKIVKYYDSVIKEYMLLNYNSAELIIKNEIKEESFTLPTITIEELERLFECYIKSDESNINYLDLFLKLKYIDNKIISPKIKILAEQAKTKKEDDFFKNNFSIKSETKIGFVNNNEIDYYEDITCLNETYLYNINYLTDDLTTPTILNNFITFFDYIDIYNHINLLPYKYEMGIFEQSIAPKYEKFYLKNLYFEKKQNKIIAQLSLYYNTLKNKNIFLENIIYDYYTNYIVNEFAMPPFILSKINNSTTYYEKCCLLFIMIESIIKQFQLYVEHKDINSSLLQFYEDLLKPQTIGSLLKYKYVYGGGDDFIKITRLLFSGQTLLGYTKKTHDKYPNFYELLFNEKMCFNDFEEFKQNDLKYLIEKDIIVNDENDLLQFVDLNLIDVLYQLYYYGYIFMYKNFTYFQKSYVTLIKKNLIRFESTLLSSQEADYFNYFLNDYFTNGLALRNKYAHGINCGLSEKENFQNYMILLHLAILLTIKINIEFNYTTSDLYGSLDLYRISPQKLQGFFNNFSNDYS